MSRAKRQVESLDDYQRDLTAVPRFVERVEGKGIERFNALDTVRREQLLRALFAALGAWTYYEGTAEPEHEVTCGAADGDGVCECGLTALKLAVERVRSVWKGVGN